MDQGDQGRQMWANGGWGRGGRSFPKNKIPFDSPPPYRNVFVCFLLIIIIIILNDHEREREREVFKHAPVVTSNLFTFFIKKHESFLVGVGTRRGRMWYL